MIIAIDGYSATGKSTLAALLAEKLRFRHVNSGLIYRAISFNLLNNDIGLHNYKEEFEKVKQLTSNFEIDIEELEKNARRLKASQVSALGAQIAKLQFVREASSTILRAAAKNSNLVVEGRDIGTVIFPNAAIKFYFMADSNIRAQRLGKESNRIDFESIKQEIEARDKEDENRTISPLRHADNSIEIDTSFITVTETLALLEKYVNEIKK